MKLRHIALLAAAVTAAPLAAEQLSIDEIVQLSSLQMGDDAIIAKINSSGSTFALSTQQMIELKAKGVSGPVLAAMLNAGTVKTGQMAPDSADPMIPHPAGLYLLEAGPGGAKMVRIDATMTNQVKTGGILGYAFTGGIASMSIKAAIQNDTARIKTNGGAPVFYFFFDESNPESVKQSIAWSAGTNAVATSPSEFTLTKLMKKQGRREARVGSVNIGGAKTGVMDSDRIAFDYEQVRPGVFKARAQSALVPGEYAFIYAIAGAGGGGVQTARLFDFTIL